MKRRLAVVVVLACLLSLLLVSSVSAATCWTGVRKDLYYDSNGWHHYVVFNPNMSVPKERLYATGPQSPQVWGWFGYEVRVGYSWPWKFASPWPASDWKLCVK